MAAMVHVTHEAAHHIGGIGTVLRGLLTSDGYQQTVDRTLLIGPMWDSHGVEDAESALGHPEARVQYATGTGVDALGLGVRLSEIESACNVSIVLGSRPYLGVESDSYGHTRGVDVDVALIDVRAMWVEVVNGVKRTLYDRFGLTSDRYEHDQDYEQWVRLAYPALLLCDVLLEEIDDRVLVSHEYMGMPSALLASADPERRYTTILHGHECASVRPIVEHHAGHDAAFYSAMEQGIENHKTLEGVFGDQSGMPRHALVSRAHHLDATLAVGSQTAAEFGFLSEPMRRARVEVCPNGVASEPLEESDIHDARARVDNWLQEGLGFRPDVLITHVTRPVVSKGLWRDLAVCDALSSLLASRDQRAAYLLVTTSGDARSACDVAAMSAEYGWPFDHREGWPDLVGVESELLASMRRCERRLCDRFGMVLVNQWCQSSESFGTSARFTMRDLRLATDVELGLSVYEPFGIAPLEPLYAGAICVVTSVSGCAGFVVDALERSGVRSGDAPNLVIADCTRHDHPDPLRMTQGELRDIEGVEMRRVAEAIDRRLRGTTRADRLTMGQRVSEMLSWDRVARDWFLPIVDDAMRLRAHPSPA
ncbi:MAG: hypothetical protein ACF8GE_04820 [Phycisphaerales bacterium JB043]